MRYQILLALTAISSIFAKDATIKSCKSFSSHPLFIDLRHTEHQGIGYHTGYTTIETFWIPSDKVFSCYPYFDFRGHIFNNGRGAFNVGVGARFLNDRILGFNTYYSFRSTEKKNFNQLAAGFESIGESFDFFANGYLVVGDKKGSPYNVKFSHFLNNTAYLKERVNYAMSGLDGKIRYHFLKKEGYDLFFDIGPYCYFRKENAIGGQAKLGATIANYVFLEANTSYDHLFKWIGQGVFGINIPLGPKNSSTKASKQSCHDAIIMRDRLTQIPATQEIIVVDRRWHSLPAIDPLTGLPYYFLFVNNLFGSQGTYEDPYGSLAAAEAASSAHDIIYVMPGDGTSTNMNTGFIFKDYQQLLGSGTTQVLSTQKGEIEIPNQTGSMPIITNETASAVTLATHNTVSGIHIVSPNLHGIVGSELTDTTISNNWIEHVNVSNTAHTYAIDLYGPGLSGTLLVYNNTISQSASDHTGGGVNINSGDAGLSISDICTVNIMNNTISVNGYGIQFDSRMASETTLNIDTNTIITTHERGISISGPHNTGRLYYSIINNSISRSSGGIALGFDGRDTSYSSGTVSNNIFYNSNEGIRFATGGSATTMILTADSNTFTNNLLKDFYADIPGDKAGFECIQLTRNYAPSKGFFIENISTTPSSRINITAFSGNTGSLDTSASTASVTYNATCDN